MGRWWKFVSWVLFLGLILFLWIHGFKGRSFYELKRKLSATYKPFFYQPPDVSELHDPKRVAAVPSNQRTYKRPRNVAFLPHHHFHPLPNTPVVGPVVAPVPSHSQVAFPPDRLRNHGSPYHNKGPTSSAPSQTSSTFKGKPQPSLPQPVQALPLAPPNIGCLPLTCRNPLTNSPVGSPCACVLPIRVGLQLDVAPYTFFPLVSQLSQEIASGVFMDQNQVRVMGANAANEEPDKTIIFIHLVPYGILFDNTTALLIYEKFWNKKIFIKDRVFRDYDVLYVLYPGLPSSPPMAAGRFGINSNGRTINPLAVDVRELKEKQHKELKTLVILSSATALVLFVGAVLFLFLKCRYYQHAAAPQQNSLNSLGITSTISKMKSFADSATLTSSIMPHVGFAKTFNIAEIEKATNKFDASRIIGEGGFGRVYEGTLLDGTPVAVKVLKRYDQHGNREFLAEVEMLCRLHHRNLVKLIGICTEDYIRCLVYELVPNGSVEFHLHGAHRKSTPLEWNSRMKIALGAARCLAYLHEDSNPCVIHRDFKSSNVLLEYDFTPKVSDLGLARTALNGGNEHISTHVVGTFGYVAPEYAMTGHLLVKSDVYSYGVVLLELLTGRKPVDIMRPPGQENLVTWTRPLLASKEGLETILDPSLGSAVPFDSITKVAAIASMCVEVEFSQRPSMGEVVQALKLVYHESNDHLGSVSCSHEDFTIFHSESKAASGIGFRAESAFPTAFNNSSRFIGYASGSFRRHSSSGPLRTGRIWKFWPWFKTNSAGGVSEHAVAIGYSRGMKSGEFWP
ncbi:hypothetical protein M5K25_012946 [Dendrobium thyrsiflorum]|uniref:Protein kinase domain-containing protein n=1 Tax=Dendrobium thyrsiflorum TaxID=117978 RepID=A0ABD0V5M8_DENTH